MQLIPHSVASSTARCRNFVYAITVYDGILAKLSRPCNNPTKKERGDSKTPLRADNNRGRTAPLAPSKNFYDAKMSVFSCLRPYETLRYVRST